MTVRTGNLFADVSAANAGEETFSEIFARPGLKIERIISQGQASPPEFWYKQGCNEWVCVLKGSATLQFEDEPATRPRGPGDYVFIPAGKRHRVEWTDPQRQQFGSPFTSSDRLWQLHRPIRIWRFAGDYPLLRRALHGPITATVNMR